MLFINRKIRIQAGLNNYELVAKKLEELTLFAPRARIYETPVSGQKVTSVYFDNVTIKEEDLEPLIEYLKTIEGVVSITY